MGSVSKQENPNGHKYLNLLEVWEMKIKNRVGWGKLKIISDWQNLKRRLLLKRDNHILW